jgi:hypothetical protein
MKSVDVPFIDALQMTCGSLPAVTDKNGRFVTYSCVFPYNGDGLLSILPDVEHPAPLNGVDVDDLTIISEHILGIRGMESPFQHIAADASNSGSITTLDIVELRKLILGIYTELPNNTSWRYIPELCFTDPSFEEEFYDFGTWPNPFDAVWVNPEEPLIPSPIIRTYGNGPLLTSPNSSSWMDHVSLNPTSILAEDVDSWSFWGVKIGDVNCSAISNAEPPQIKNDKPFATVPHSPILTNQIFTLQIKVLGTTPVSAWQLGVEFAQDSLEIIQVQPGNSGETFLADNFGLTEIAQGKLRALNFSETGAGLNLNNTTLFKLKVKALKPIANINQHFHLKNSILTRKFFSTEMGFVA